MDDIYTAEFTPELCRPLIEGDEQIPNRFSGHVKVKVPEIEDRFAMRQAMGMNDILKQAVTADGKVDTDSLNVAEIAKQFISIETAIKMVKLAKPFILEVHITRTSDGKKYSSFRDLSVATECEIMLIEIGREIVMGRFSGLSGSESGNG